MLDIILNEDIKKTYEIRNKIYNAIDNDRAILISMKLEYLMPMLGLINPQKAHPVLEEFFINKIVGTKIDKSLNNGDFTKDGNFNEIKASLITDSNNTLNLRQVRLYQKNGFYYCWALDIRDINNIKQHLYKLSHAQMTEESKIMKFTPTHKTKGSITNDENIELSGNLTMSDRGKHFKRWNEKYLIDSSFLLS